MKKLIILLFLVYSFGSNQLTLAMPKDIKTAALNAGCESIPDFYERDGEVNPDYLNIQDGGLNIDGAWRSSFWCRPRGKNNVYWLVFLFEGMPSHQRGCKPILEWSEKPRGLSVHTTKIQLASFYEVGTRRKLKASGLTNYKPIVDIYDGAGYAFYCHDQKWYYAPLH
jgi:hypothetical protein